jgi:ABC-2 type transport system permease protein
MNKIFIIIKREYLTRVKKKSFIIMTFLGPVLMAAVYILPVFFATLSDEKKTVQVIDETGMFVGKLKNTDKYTFIPIDIDIETAKENLSNSGDYGLLYIPLTQLSVPSGGVFYTLSSPGMDIVNHMKRILEREVESQKLEIKGLDPEIVRGINSTFYINKIEISRDGKLKESTPIFNMGLSVIFALMIYMFIFIFGSQVLRGVLEEKTNRIVEVIVSSVKPFQLMMGKIVGIAMVGLTQFMLWVVLTLLLVTIIGGAIGMEQLAENQQQIMGTQGKMLNQEQLADFSKAQNQDNDFGTIIIQGFANTEWGVMIGAFLFYFLFGYFLYGALMGAVGSAVDNETDTQQFMLPITIPLLLGMIMLGFIISNPHGPVAFWLSIIPLTSPVVMLARLPFGVPVWEVWLSMGLLVLGFLGATWLAAKIYRTGILMYGKKPTYKELWKWIKYRN